jgi:hypothetical protein
MVTCERCGKEYNSSIAANLCCTDEQRPWRDENDWG